jgi:transcriptional regulator with XRE-family HTH domain
MAIGFRLKALRAKNRQSLQEVADAVGASKTHIWDLETGRSENPSIELLTKLAGHFRVSIADLVGENPNAEGESGELIALYRDLKSLSDTDRETIRVLMERFTKPKSPQ